MKNVIFALLFATSLSADATMPPEAAMCSACHGADGQSHHPEWPNLAGQHTLYLLKQLHAYQQGNTRSSPIMGPMVASLSETTLNELAAFYAQQPLAAKKKPPANVRGEALYRQGDARQHIPACIACHGPDGHGNAMAGFPLLSRQPSAYTVQQLLAFQQKKRTTDPNGIMRDITANMSQADIKAVADYLETL